MDEILKDTLTKTTKEETENINYPKIIKLNENLKFFPQRKYQTKQVQPTFNEQTTQILQFLSDNKKVVSPKYFRLVGRC